MRIYAGSTEEILRARKLLTQWTEDGILSNDQHQRLAQETVSDLRTTNIFLRLVLFFFTLIGVAAAVALIYTSFPTHTSEQATGIFFLISAAASYVAAESIVAQARLYRYGIEEALAVCSVALLCAGVGFAFFSSSSSSEIEFVIPAIGAAASLWIWYRFNLWYAFPAAMICAVFLPGYWPHSQAAQHIFIAVLYSFTLIAIVRIRTPHRFDYLANAYSLSEAFLWLGIYLVLNLKISDFSLLIHLGAPMRFHPGPAGPFYWTTWVLTWCLPPLILTRGISMKDRFILAVGAITAVLTLVTNKPYLGWQRHTWDPMLLGIALTGVSIFLRRWLARGPDGVRYGFTAAPLSAKDKHTMSLASSALGLVTPQSITPAPQPAKQEFHFGEGASGGGGADF